MLVCCVVKFFAPLSRPSALDDNAFGRVALRVSSWRGLGAAHHTLCAQVSLLGGALDDK
jgi:hypothetical protein